METQKPLTQFFHQTPFSKRGHKEMIEIGPIAQEEHWGAIQGHGASCAPSTMCHAALLPPPKMNVNGERKK